MGAAGSVAPHASHARQAAHHTHARASSASLRPKSHCSIVRPSKLGGDEGPKVQKDELRAAGAALRTPRCRSRARRREGAAAARLLSVVVPSRLSLRVVGSSLKKRHTCARMQGTHAVDVDCVWVAGALAAPSASAAQSRHLLLCLDEGGRTMGSCSAHSTKPQMPQPTDRRRAALKRLASQ